MTTPRPSTGEDTFDLIDDAVAALADRRGVWLGDDVRTITLIASLIEQADACPSWSMMPARTATAGPR